MGILDRSGLLLDALGPRRLRSARASLAGVVSTATLAYLAVALLRPEAATVVDFGTTGALLAIAVGLLRLPPAPAAALCVLTYLIGIAVIVVLDLASRDATVVGQVFFYLPVVSAATQLKVPGAALVTTTAIVGEAIVVFTLLPAQEAWTDLAFVGTTLATSAFALARAGVQQDRLVGQLRHQAAIDPLTGLWTRRALDEATTAAVLAAQRNGPPGAALLLIDVDRFKLINDRHGHIAGDAALQRIAELSGERSYSGDVVARMGGDELAILLPGCDYTTALRRATALVDEVHATTVLLADGTAIPLSISVGAAHIPDHATSSEELYARADEALYAAKRAGRGRACALPADEAVLTFAS